MSASDPNLAAGSPQGSPYGSPHGQSQGVPMPDAPAGLPQQQLQGVQAEMAHLMRMVATAATAAAEAAKAATGASQGSAPDRKKELYKLIPKPAMFAPGDREQEVAQWRDWYWSLKQYLTVIDNKFEDDIAYVERSNVTEVDIDLLEDEERHRGRFLYSLLSSLLQGRLLSLVRNVDTSNGLEALRHLLENCQPRARNRTMSMLQSIMSYPNFVMKNSIMSQLVRLEEHFVQFEKMGGKLTDEMKSAVVLKCVSGPLKIHLNLSLNESSTYPQIREVIKAYDTATTKWTDSVSSSPYSPQTAADPTGLVPMEIDRVKGGKAAGKGKGKSKEGKGKAKGKEQKGKGKTYGKQNQWNSTSTTSWSTTSKSGKGGDQNDKGKGKSKSKDGVACFNCGRVGHMAKDCWRVRQVGNPEASSTVLSSVTGQESVGPSVSQAATAVKRVAFSAGEHDPVVFDMRSSSTSSWCHCRMVNSSALN